MQFYASFFSNSMLLKPGKRPKKVLFSCNKNIATFNLYFLCLFLLLLSLWIISTQVKFPSAPEKQKNYLGNIWQVHRYSLILQI